MVYGCGPTPCHWQHYFGIILGHQEEVGGILEPNLMTSVALFEAMLGHFKAISSILIKQLATSRHSTLQSNFL